MVSQEYHRNRYQALKLCQFNSNGSELYQASVLKHNNAYNAHHCFIFVFGDDDKIKY